MAVFPIQLTRKPHQTGEPWHLSCHGGKTPAKPHVPRAAPRPKGAVWGAGALPLLVEFDDAGVLGDDLLLVVDKGGLGGLGKGGLLAVYQHFHFFHSGELGAGE